MVATKSKKELTLKQLEKLKLSELHQKYLQDRKGIVEEFNIMKTLGKYKIIISHHRGIISFSFSADDFWSKYGGFIPADKNLLEKLLKLYPPEPIYYHKSTFTGIRRENDPEIRKDGKTELIFPIYLSTQKNYHSNLIGIKWKTKTHDITIELERNKTTFNKIIPQFSINYSDGYSIIYFPYREDLNILEYIQ
jgi:hypothetical protein